MTATATILMCAFLYPPMILSTVSAFTTLPLQPRHYASWSAPGRIAVNTENSQRIHTRSSKTLSALPTFQWLFQKKDKDINNESAKEFTGESAKEAEMMHRTAKMMEKSRRSQEAAERTAAMMEELSSSLVVGKSKAGASGGIGLGGANNRRGGVKVTFNGQQRPIGVDVDPNFLFSSSMSESQGVISIEELNEAMTDAMQDAYDQSGKLMEEKIKGLYEQLGLSREPPSLPSEQGDVKK
eukprot:CAMPEP_0172324932 /NCGR_PEP_ID=MMETSP1058-20130122/52689_1 /TAXON_ID=83371 /ORGANISM="Detonula confervacea, Strain CCMP 353" /LENGTH=239 /DNA_ID=CAMNT_0013041355 /DNA_START=280 /DNA_END=999 /DNA_ORIENTATION=+